MEENIKTVGVKVVIDGSEVEPGLRKIDEGAAKTARNLESLGSNEGFAKLGQGAEGAGVKVDRVTKSLADSIVRATAAMEAGTKGTAEYYSALAGSRGANGAVLKPLLDQLDAVTKKTVAAADAQKRMAESESFISGLRSKSDAIGKTASQLAAMRAAELGVSEAAGPMIERLREAEEASGGFGESLGGVQGVLAALGVAMSAGAFTAWVKGAIDAADGLKDLSASTAISVEDLAGLQLASKQTGAELEGTAAAINKLSVNIGKDSEKFAKLGITAKEPLEAFKQLADVFNAIEDPQKRAAFGAAALGKSWQDAAPLLSEGSAKIDEMVERGRTLSGITTQMADDADEFNDVLAELSTSTDALSTKLAISFLPILQAISEDLRGTSKDANDVSGILVTGLAEAFRAVTILGGNVAFVLKTIGSDIGGIAAQLTMLATLDFDGFERANELMKQDAIAGRKAFDEWEKKILEAGTNVKAAAASAAEGAADALQGTALKELTALIDDFNGAVDDAAKKAEEATKKRVAAADKERQAYAGLTASINERIASVSREANGLDAMTESQKLQASLNEKISSGLLVLTAEHKKAYEARIKILAVDEAVLASQKRAQAGAAAWTKIEKEASDAAARTISDAVREAEQNEQLAATFGMTRAEIEALTLARLEEQFAQRATNTLTLSEIENLEKLIAAKRRSAAALSTIDSKEAAKKANEAMVADWDKTVDKYDDIFSTGFADMLNKGEEGWDSFNKSLLTTFKTSVADQLYKALAQPFVVKLVASLVGVTGGAGGVMGGGSGGGAMQWLETGKSIYTGFSGAFASGMGTTISNMGSIFGSSAMTQFGAGMTTGPAAQSMATTFGAPSAATSAGSSFASALPVVGWIAAGMALSNNLFKDGWDARNGSLSSTGPIAPFNSPMIQLNRTLQGIGLSDGMSNMLSGASTVSRLFGRKNPEVQNFGIEGTFGSSGFSGNAYQNILEKGGIFRSDKEYQKDSALDVGTDSTFDDTIKNLMFAVKGFGVQMGIEATQIDSYTKSIQLTLTSDDAKNQELITGVFTGIGDDLARLLLPSITELGAKGETAGAALERIAGNYVFIDGALNAIGMTFGTVGVNSILARERLVELIGGVDAFGKGAAFFAQNYLNEAERLAPVAATVEAALAGLGFVGDKALLSRDDFKEAVLGLQEGGQLATEAGATTFAGLMKVQEAFALLHPVIDTTTDAINAAKESAKSAAAERASLQDQLDALTLSPEKLAEKTRSKVAVGNVDLFDQVAAAGSSKSAMESLTAANQYYIDKLKELDRATMSAADLREDDTAGMHASTAALYDQYVARTAANAAEAKVAAANQFYIDKLHELERATMNAADLRADDIDGMDATTVALYDQYMARTALAELEKSRASELAAEMDKRFSGSTSKGDSTAADRTSLETRLLALTGTAVQKLARTRMLELAATNDLLDPILLLIYAQEDLASATAASEAATKLATEALKASANSAFDVLSNSVNVAKGEAKSDLDSKVAILNAQKAASATQFEAQSAFAQSVVAGQQKVREGIAQLANSLRSTLSGMRLDANQATDRVTAQKLIADALEAAKRGVLPSSESLSGALGIVSQKDMSGFSSYIEFARDFGVTAGRVADLGAIADGRLEVADRAVLLAQAQVDGIAAQARATAEGFDEQIKKAQEEYDLQIEQYDETIQVARDQLEAALGTKLAVLDVKDALLSFAASISELRAVSAAPAAAASVGTPAQVQTYANPIALSPVGPSNVELAAQVAQLNALLVKIQTASEATAASNQQLAGQFDQVSNSGKVLYMEAG